MHIALDYDTDSWLALVVIHLLDPLTTAHPKTSSQPASFTLRPVLGLVLLLLFADLIAAGLDLFLLVLVLAILENSMSFFLNDKRKFYCDENKNIFTRPTSVSTSRMRSPAG